MRPSNWITTSLALGAALLLSCSSDPNPCPDGSRCIDAGRADTGPADIAPDRVVGNDVPPLRMITSVRLDPAMVTMSTTVGTPRTQAFRAIATYNDGRELPVSGAWSLAEAVIGNVDPTTGTFTANGIRGGIVRLQFRTMDAGGGAADAMITVSLTRDLAPATPPGSTAPDSFSEAGMPVADPTAQATVLYPLDNVLFPQNITAPLVQWQGGVAGDFYRLTYSKPHITVRQYVVHNGAGFTYSAALPDDVWSRIAETDPDQSATLVVDRYEIARTRAVAGAPMTIRFAQGSVSGTVYYWQMDRGQLHRIPAGTVADQHLFPAGIRGTPETAPTYTYSGCIACHQISRDGRYLVANGTEAYVFDLSAVDPTGAMVPVRVRPGYRWYFATMSPDNTRVFATSPDARLSYVNPETMQDQPVLGMPLATGQFAHPFWSPDGRSIAIISNVLGWTSNAAFTGGDLAVIPVTAADTFGPAQTIHRGADAAMSDPAGGTADCFPSWTPDSRNIAFAHTPNTRATGGDGRVPGSMYMISAAPMAGGMRAPVRLARASDEGSEPRAHYPNLSPFISGGYYWLLFYSDRYYGNTQVGTRPNRRPQLWVTAISTTFDGTTDPSQVPYWLPGQEVAQQNADGVWAAAACRMTGATCRTSTDCCSGACVPGGDGMFRCMPPPTCRREGESCERDADCCGTGVLTCDSVIRTCQRPIG